MYIAYYFFWYSWGGRICEKEKRYILGVGENHQFVVIHLNKKLFFFALFLLVHIFCQTAELFIVF